MKYQVILIVVGVLETMRKDLETRLRKLEIRERIKTLQTTALLQSTKIRKKNLGYLRGLVQT